MNLPLQKELEALVHIAHLTPSIPEAIHDGSLGSAALVEVRRLQYGMKLDDLRRAIADLGDLQYRILSLAIREREDPELTNILDELNIKTQ